MNFLKIKWKYIFKVNRQKIRVELLNRKSKKGKLKIVEKIVKLEELKNYQSV